ncbi:MAG: ABC transporter ATP-binding protein [Gemmatimonadetes bacterium]|nr:ABC transporter ATP-binding protein [Gemmatimonadota bacterium]
MKRRDQPCSVRVRGLVKSFGQLRVLDDVSLDFQDGRVSALIGPNGAGKTTLIKSILGLVRPNEGTVLVNQTATDRRGVYRFDLGYMPQLPHFPSHMTGAALASMLDDLRSFEGEPDEELLDAFDLREDFHKPFKSLSGGTRQQVNAALAFRYPAKVLILDEPTAGLDPVAALALKEKIQRGRDRGRTVIVTSHNLGDLQSLADDIVFLLEGRVRFEGSMDALLDTTGRLRLEESIADLMRGGRGYQPHRGSDPLVADDGEGPEGQVGRPGLRVVP